MWGTVAKIVATILGMKNQRFGNIYNAAMGLANSARSAPQPQARQM